MNTFRQKKNKNMCLNSNGFLASSLSRVSIYLLAIAFSTSCTASSRSHTNTPTASHATADSPTVTESKKPASPSPSISKPPKPKPAKPPALTQSATFYNLSIKYPAGWTLFTNESELVASVGERCDGERVSIHLVQGNATSDQPQRTDGACDTTRHVRSLNVGNLKGIGSIRADIACEAKSNPLTCDAILSSVSVSDSKLAKDPSLTRLETPIVALVDEGIHMIYLPGSLAWFRRVGHGEDTQLHTWFRTSSDIRHIRSIDTTGDGVDAHFFYAGHGGTAGNSLSVLTRSMEDVWIFDSELCCYVDGIYVSTTKGRSKAPADIIMSVRPEMYGDDEDDSKYECAQFVWKKTKDHEGYVSDGTFSASAPCGSRNGTRIDE